MLMKLRVYFLIFWFIVYENMFNFFLYVWLDGCLVYYQVLLFEEFDIDDGFQIFMM